MHDCTHFGQTILTNMRGFFSLKNSPFKNIAKHVASRMRAYIDSTKSSTIVFENISIYQISICTIMVNVVLSSVFLRYEDHN